MPAGTINAPQDEDEVESYLAALPVRERLVARFATFEGMRPGEILALRWRNIQSDKLGVEQRVYRRKSTFQILRKTNASLAKK